MDFHTMNRKKSNYNFNNWINLGCPLILLHIQCWLLFFNPFSPNTFHGGKCTTPWGSSFQPGTSLTMCSSSPSLSKNLFTKQLLWIRDYGKCSINVTLLNPHNAPLSRCCRLITTFNDQFLWSHPTVIWLLCPSHPEVQTFSSPP